MKLLFSSCLVLLFVHAAPFIRASGNVGREPSAKSFYSDPPVQQTPRAFLCPRDGDAAIAPCTCDAAIQYVLCASTTLTNSQIANALNVLRSENSLGNDDVLTFDTFQIYSNTLEELDLTPLLNTKLENFRAYYSTALKLIVGPPLSDATRGKIDVYHLDLDGSNLTDEILGESLMYFSKGMVRLHLGGNQFQGSASALLPGQMLEEAGEFFPGLSSFVNLRFLYLYDNSVTRVGGRQFWSNSKLESIYLYDNQIYEVGRDAFAFNPQAPSNARLNISLQGNALSSCDIHPYSGFGSFSRPVDLFFDNNHVLYLPQSQWEPFLNSSSARGIDMLGNPLHCDARMKWLKDGAAIYQPRIVEANCANDPGHSVFTTSKI